jgi:phage host-nuclease inhibitor protein Gam
VTTIEYEVTEADDLAATLDTIAADSSPESLDAAASNLLRAIGAMQRNLKRYQDTKARELEHLDARYAYLCEPLEQRIAQFTEAVEEIARRAKFDGRSRSRNVGYGIYGVRKQPEKVKVIDKLAALDFARAMCPEAVEVRSEEVLSAATVKPAVLAHLASTGEVPQGFEHTAAHDKPYIEVLAPEDR